MGYLPYEHPLYRHLTVLENLRYFYRCFHGKNLDVQDAAVQEVLQALSIDYLNQRMDQCSSAEPSLRPEAMWHRWMKRLYGM